MMQINLDLNVATVDFLRSIDGKEIELDFTIQNEHVYLLIYPKAPVYVHAINDMFENCQYDIVGAVDLQVGFDEHNPFRYDLGLYINDSAPFITNDDVMYDMINQLLVFNGIIDEDNEDVIVFTDDCLSGIRNTSLIVDVTGDCLDEMELEVIEIHRIDYEFIDWINNHYEVVINKFVNNKNTWQGILDNLKNNKTILDPSSAFELAQVKLEYDETKRSLRYYQKQNMVTIPKDDLQRLNKLLDSAIVMLSQIIEVDFANGGNLGVFIESMANDIPIDFDMVNVSDNMISIDFKTYYE